MSTKSPHIFYFHASSDLYGSDYVLLELIRAASKKYTAIVFLPQDGPLVAEVRKHATVIICSLAILRREYFSVIGLCRFVMNIFKSVYIVCDAQRNLNVVAFHTNTSAVWTGYIAAFLLRKRHFWQVMEIIEKPKIVSILMSKVVGVFSYKVFCISDAVRHHFLLSNVNRMDRFETIYHGVDRSIYDPAAVSGGNVRANLGLADDTVLVGFAGRFNAWKGQEVLALAAIQVLLDIDAPLKVHFLFLGSVYADQHQYLDELESICNSNPKLKARSTILGFQRDFENWLGAMDILVLPSKSPEPNATVTVAAMTLGKPVIGTNIGGTVEAIDDGVTGFLVAPSDPNELAKKIEVLCLSPLMRETFGKNARDRAEELFSIDRYTEEVLLAYIS